MDEPKDILTFNETKLADEDLLGYLQDMPGEEKKLFEKKLTDEFETDAVEGLQQIKDKAQLQNEVKQLQRKLPQLLRTKKLRQPINHLKDFQWMIVALVLLLLICAITYLVIHLPRI